MVIEGSVTLPMLISLVSAISFSMNQSIDPYEFEVLSTRFSSDLRLRGGLDLGGTVRVREERKNPLVEELPAPEPDSTRVGDLNPDDPRYADIVGVGVAEVGGVEDRHWRIGYRSQ